MSDSRFSPAQLPRLTHPDGTPIKVLVVDDEPSLAELVAMGTRMLGWEATMAHDGPEAVATARSLSPDVLVLDWMLPGFDGPEVLRKVRSYLPEVPVLFLTAKDAVEDRIEGLGAGADDYVAKPFSLEEVLIRLHRLVERSGASTADSAELVVGDLVLNLDSHDVSRAGRSISLTATEFDLLSYLMNNARRVVSKSQILDNVWHYDFDGQANIVELYISYLRKKIDVDAESMIHTVRGVGYVLKPAA
ncbi:DNA-binding response regulator [Arthrobacter sp. MYb211]|uniref:response regulator transcription factor n=1 Tax=Micrococcaceae TaxID=1268 RepID=UPI000BB76431|nr:MULTISPECIES: response regulator transcription factor [Micrococcaceae]PCC28767.1 DNA-binding response regulator [Glutamicibacter sp. BW80]PQZ98648.1 DNA-binding response regulator [Arthrobacter sp. MYb224]PRA02982.1 DNA-binding response regulator [Arthrobacter sp. MYb229]PRA11055.1 DNA-binding response regulator [Arthrobacter sp. MYb221]PRB49452.1 DNA-binding response regulator [Arthrobacter sp. MYb216]